MKTNTQKMLYYTAGPMPSKDELAEAEKLGISAFRNASEVDTKIPLERADVVAGLVPAGYHALKNPPKIVPSTIKAAEKAATKPATKPVAKTDDKQNSNGQ